MKKIFFAILSLALVIAACKSPSNDTKAPEEKPEMSEMKYTLTPFTASPEFPDAKIEDVTFDDGKFSFDISSETYELGVQTDDAPQKMCANSAQGQHIHLIIDNAPYAAKYTAEFDYDVADGEKYTLAFLSRSYHESIKTEDAHAIFKGIYTGNGLTAKESVTEPMLFYSRPKGAYVGKANTDKVMLDFYLVNTSLGNNKVKADINGEIHMLDTWQPYYIEGLPMGDNTITLTLVDKDGNKVDTPLNPVSRTFKLEADPTEG